MPHGGVMVQLAPRTPRRCTPATITVPSARTRLNTHAQQRHAARRWGRDQLRHRTPAAPGTNTHRWSSKSSPGGRYTSPRIVRYRSQRSPAPRTPSTGCPSSTACGRIADRAAVAALRWTPGTRLRVHIAQTHLTLRAAIDGPLAVKDQRFLWLPAATRHRLGLRPGDRVLLAAEPKRQTLVIYPPATLDELLAHARSASKGGDRDE